MWCFDAGGRLLGQRKRTGERDFTVEYVDAAGTRGQIARVVDAVGGAYVLGYAGNKRETIADPQGRLTRFVVDGSGDLVSMVEPDGETHRFTYDGHRMVTKTSPRGDVTTYGYDANGVIATSSKPGGENYAFEAALSSPPSYDASGATVRTGAVTDARGVRRAFRTDIFGRIEEETFAADGVTRTVSSVHPATIGSADEPPAAARNNTFRRTSHQTVNGAPLTPPLEFDSFGRAVRQLRGGADTAHLWTYGADGWLASFFAGPSNDTQRIERDAAGHVTRIFDVEGAGAGTATGREMRFTWRSDRQPATMTEYGVTSTFSYDDAGARNLIGVADTLGRSVSLTYDAYGNVASTTDGTASASFTFDVGISTARATPCALTYRINATREIGIRKSARARRHGDTRADTRAGAHRSARGSARRSSAGAHRCAGGHRASSARVHARARAASVDAPPSLPCEGRARGRECRAARLRHHVCGVSGNQEGARRRLSQHAQHAARWLEQ